MNIWTWHFEREGHRERVRETAREMDIEIDIHISNSAFSTLPPHPTGHAAVKPA